MSFGRANLMNFKHLTMRGIRHAWSEAPGNFAYAGGTKRTGALGARADDWTTGGRARAHRALGGRWSKHRGGGTSSAPRFGCRATVARALAREAWECGRAVSGCAQVRPT